MAIVNLRDAKQEILAELVDCVVSSHQLRDVALTDFDLLKSPGKNENIASPDRFPLKPTNKNDQWMDVDRRIPKSIGKRHFQHRPLACALPRLRN